MSASPRWAAPLAGLVLTGALAALPVGRALFAAPWERLVDLEVYREAGVSVLRGRPVYDHLTPVPNLLPFTYPPAAALAAVPLALLPAGGVGVLWTLGQVAVLARVVTLAFRPLLDRARAAGPALVGLLAGASCWLVPVSDGLRFGQVDVLLVALCLAGCSGPPARAALAGAAAAVKLTPAVFVLHLALAGRRTAALAAAGAAALLTVLAALALPEAAVDYWGRVLLDSDRLGANAGTANQSLRGVLLRVGPDGAAGTALWLLLALAAAWFGFRAAAAAARAGEDVRAVALVGLLAVLLSPVAWIHHLAWVVVALGALVGDGRSRRRWMVAGTVAVFFAVPVPWLGVAVLEADGPAWLGRALQQGYCAGAVALLVALGSLSAPRPGPAADRRRERPPG